MYTCNRTLFPSRVILSCPRGPIQSHNQARVSVGGEWTRACQGVWFIRGPNGNSPPQTSTTNTVVLVICYLEKDVLLNNLNYCMIYVQEQCMKHFHIKIEKNIKLNSSLLLCFLLFCFLELVSFTKVEDATFCAFLTFLCWITGG